MLNRLLFVFGACLLSMSSAATAAFTFNSNDQTGTSGGKDYLILFNGQAAGEPAEDVSSVMRLIFFGTSNQGRTFNFQYSLWNNSLVYSTLHSFGFDVSGATLQTASSTGSFTSVGYNQLFPEELGSRDVCLHVGNGSTCTDGASGVTRGQTAYGSLALSFFEAPDSITFNNLAAQYHSISPQVNGSSLAVSVGGPFPPLPEPATWALMLIGFGTVGIAMRRRSASNNLQRLDTAAV